MKRNQKKLYVTFAVVAVFVSVPLLFIAWLAATTEVPKQLRLADCDSSEIRLSSTLPPGTHFTLVLGVPRSADLPPSFRGHITISESGHSITDYPIGSDDLQRCNWLHSTPELQGYIITWRSAPEIRIRDILRGKHTYDFVIGFSNMPPNGSSLWITWLQRWRD